MAGKLTTVVTYLEMHAPPGEPPRAPPPGLRVEVIEAVRPTVPFYRWLYGAVGEPWLWTDRHKLDDAALVAILEDPAVQVHVLHVDGAPAGYAELDGRQPPDVELAYFGLLPDFIGRGLGRFLLDWAVQRAFSTAPRRLWVHTQTLDHPRALPVYQAAGFRAYRSETILVDDPR
jgi:GNAT superfamily N-acetyltransferase